MKSRNNSVALFGLGMSFAFSQMVGCEAIDTCENRLDCSHYATGGTGAMGDGDGDGDENTGGSGGSGGHAPSTGGAAPGSGASDSSGGMGGVPFSCDECTGDTPACDNEAEECFACTQDDATHCDPETPVCGADNSCVQCTTQNPTACTDTEAPVCGPENTCVQCTEQQADACTDTDTPVCSPENTCVQCTDAEMHCPELSAPVCSEGTCTGCITHEDCSERFADTPVCEDGTGTCRECTPESEEERCGEFTCSSVTYQCTTTKRGIRDTCEPCESDSACAEGRKCVLDKFGGQDVGYFCFLEETDVGCGDKVVDRRPYRNSTELSSIDGVEQRYCLPPSSTTCQGIKDTQNIVCTTSDDCGLPELDDGYCPEVGDGAGLCSYACAGGADCTSQLECTGSPAHCNPLPLGD